ncbi:MAG: RNA 2',3'-cyclic phosphodiesterase [Candidatus Methanospirareceae archaeon]
MRAFIAVDLSGEIRAKIAGIQQEFAGLGLAQGAVKFVDAKQAHQTVKFLGNVTEDAVGLIKSALAGITQKPFELELRGVGFFPPASLDRARKIRVIWVGVERGAEQLKALQEEVESKMHALGFPPEKRFSPHVTLCRVKKPLRQKNELMRVLEKIEELQEVEAGKMLVEELKLKKSTLTPKGPIYEDLYVKKLEA